jgi:tRNA (guanosine-2'-O-)-methyltransferase
MNAAQRDLIIQQLKEYLTQEKWALMNDRIQKRTRYISVVLENIYQPHNASAVLRSCDGFGIQDVHIIENSNTYRINPDVVMGTTKWLNIHRYNQNPDNTAACLEQLKAKGYQIAATSLRPESIPIQDFMPTQKTALCFGTEEAGLSDLAHDLADVFVQIPMVGFVQSFNLSVSAAICLYDLTTKLRDKTDNYILPPEEQSEVLLDWLVRTVKNGELHLSKIIETL